MTIQLETYQFIMLLIAIAGVMISTVKILWGRIEQSLNQNFKATNEKLESVARQAEESQRELRQLERQLYQLEIDLPKNYVLRDDYIRGQTVIEAKLDAVASKLENVQLKQGMQR